MEIEALEAILMDDIKGLLRLCILAHVRRICYHSLQEIRRILFLFPAFFAARNPLSRNWVKCFQSMLPNNNISTGM